MRKLSRLLPLLLVSCAVFAQATLRNAALTVTVDPTDGSYTIATAAGPIVRGGVGAQVDGKSLRSADYPRHQITDTEYGALQTVTVDHSGLAGTPDLVCKVMLDYNQRHGEFEVSVQNGTGRPITVQAIRVFEAQPRTGAPLVSLGGPNSADRVLSDSYSEDRPAMKLFDLGEQPMHRAVGSQLIYNRQSGMNLFWGALTSQRFLTIFHLSQANGEITGYTIDSTGTTEIQRGEALRQAPAENQIDLSLPVAPGESLSSERVLFSAGRDYHAQLEAYGDTIRVLHHARVNAPTPIGWWSWTAFYSGLTEGTALTNIRYEAERLKSLGYTFFHIDEGYQYARGEYATPNATLFPHGMRPIGYAITHSGLTFGIWTAPFEVTNRAWVYEHHPEWLVHNRAGQPIQIGRIGEHGDLLYALDPTHPGAQNYLRQTYRTLVDDWGVRYIKMDFMDDTAIEGFHYRPNTTALEAQQIGLDIIRKTVGEGVLLDKDGSPMLNPVGYVDAGRISLDTGHSFSASKEAAPGIAARYYMNRKWFISDPDAFSVSRQLIPDQRWHQSKTPLTLDEAKVAIALDAVSGGMYEIGDDLPTLGADEDRLALLENRDLLNMARLGRASLPIDLMTYAPDDLQPSIFFLREDPRQAVLTVFNWTEQARSHSFRLSELGLPAGSYQASDGFDGKSVALEGESLALNAQPPHSVRVIKIVDSSIAPAAPAIVAHVPGSAGAGEEARFAAHLQPGSSVPALNYHWDFGDGTTADGSVVTHAYTKDGTFRVQLTADGIDGISAQQTFQISVTGYIHTEFHHDQNRRYVEPQD